MKRHWTQKVCILTMLISLGCAAPATAVDLYGFGSYWDKKDVEGSWGAGLGVTLDLFFIDYLRLDGRVYFFENSDLDKDDSLTLMPIDLGLQVHLFPDADVDPYGLAGVSFLYADADKIDVDSTFGAYIGAGLDVKLGIPFFKLFGEAIYRFSDIDTALRDDVDVSGFTTNIGLKFNF